MSATLTTETACAVVLRYQRHDLDNVNKLILNSLIGVVYADDPSGRDWKESAIFRASSLAAAPSSRNASAAARIRCSSGGISSSRAKGFAVVRGNSVFVLAA